MRRECYAVQVEDAQGGMELVQGFQSIAQAEWWIEVKKRQAVRGAPPVRYFILDYWRHGERDGPHDTLARAAFGGSTALLAET